MNYEIMGGGGGGGLLNFSFSHCRHNCKLNWLLRKNEKSKIGKSIHFLNALFESISKN